MRCDNVHDRFVLRLGFVILCVSLCTLMFVIVRADLLSCCLCILMRSAGVSGAK